MKYPAASDLRLRLDESVTSYMRQDFYSLQQNLTVDEALAAIRKNPPEGRIIYFYVVDDQGALVGVLPTRRLLLSEPQSTLGSIMIGNVIVIPASATVFEACEFFMLHKLLAFPVVDAQKKPIGIVDVELYTEELTDIDRRLESEDFFQLIGVHLLDAKDETPLNVFKNRFPWLITNIVGGILAAILSGMFEAELTKAVSLALFIPVVLALAESVSIQSVSLTLQSLHGAQVTVGEVLRKLRRESLTGVLLGSACALCIGTVALLWLRQGVVATCVAGGIACGVTFAALVGVAIPNVLRMMQREPQVAAGPIALAMTDMVTLLAYFSLARMLL
jgi:magnesium transporter